MMKWMKAPRDVSVQNDASFAPHTPSKDQTETQPFKEDIPKAPLPASLSPDDSEPKQQGHVSTAYYLGAVTLDDDKVAAEVEVGLADAKLPDEPPTHDVEAV